MGIVEVLTNAGPWGALVGILGVYVAHLHKQLKQVQESRVEDAKKIVASLLDLNDKWNETIGQLKEAVVTLKIAIEAIGNRHR